MVQMIAALKGGGHSCVNRDFNRLTIWPPPFFFSSRVLFYDCRDARQPSRVERSESLSIGEIECTLRMWIYYGELRQDVFHTGGIA